MMPVLSCEKHLLEHFIRLALIISTHQWIMLHKGILVHCNDDIVGFTVITVTVPALSKISGKLTRTPSSAGLCQVLPFNVQWKKKKNLPVTFM